MTSAPGQGWPRGGWIAMATLFVLLVGATPATAQDERARYIAASIDMQCEAMQPALYHHERARERTMDRVLRRHGFTRASYASAGFAYAGQHKVGSAIVVGVSKCTPGSVRGRFRGSFSAEELDGTVEVSYRARGIRGVLRGTYRGQRIRVVLRGGLGPGARLRRAGRARKVDYAVVLTHKGDHVEGWVELDDGVETRRVILRANSR